VAGIGTVGDVGYLWCTGTLLNNYKSDFTDYFLTAHHCVGNQTEADSTEYYWFYQTSVCNGTPPSPSSVARTGQGADFLAGSDDATGNDFAFMRLRQVTPGGVRYAGWSTADPGTGAAVASIHHPDGDYKRISYGTQTGVDANYRFVRWSMGVMEPGSSGSPLFNDSRQVIGQLWGGESSCAEPTLEDEYGRFEKTYPSISQWLSAPWDDGYQDLGGGWRRLGWFGDYVPMGPDGWIWHSKHGFFYVPPSGMPADVWMYAQDMGWLWTGNQTYPFLYRASPAAWLWYNGSTNPRWFANMTAGTWESRP
jgi:hypothetical protein